MVSKEEQIRQYRKNIPDIHNGAYRKAYDLAMKRKSFKARHAKNIAKGNMSAAYWADKVKW